MTTKPLVSDRATAPVGGAVEWRGCADHRATCTLAHVAFTGVARYRCPLQLNGLGAVGN